jgi:N-acetyl-anhydromuramyl-L-alanine amidase AmpD
MGKAMTPTEWMPACKMDRVILHWTAGQHAASSIDREHYHILIEGDGKLVRGIPPITGNARPAKGARASHTLNCNTGSIGVSMCAMLGAVERPFNAGSAPLTKAQWEKAADVVADLCKAYGIHVTPRTVLSHAEVQSNLGIKQRGKWDIARLPWDARFDTARECGDLFRSMVSDRLK